MPRNVRNFWIDAQVDGKATRIASGPRSKDGGFHLRISIRDHGEVREIVSIWGIADSPDDGDLTLNIEPDFANSMRIITKR